MCDLRLLGKLIPIFLYIFPNLPSFSFLPNPSLSQIPANYKLLVSHFIPEYTNALQLPYIWMDLCSIGHFKDIFLKQKARFQGQCIAVSCFVLSQNINILKINFAYTSSVLLEVYSLTNKGNRYMNIKSII